MRARDSLEFYGTVGVREKSPDMSPADAHGFVSKKLDEHRAEVLREAADAIDQSEYLREYTDDHMGDVYAVARELRRIAGEES